MFQLGSYQVRKLTPLKSPGGFSSVSPLQMMEGMQMFD